MSEQPPDTYRTLGGPGEAEYKERGSRFIARAFPVEGEDAAEHRIEAIRSEYHRATHHCTAYRIGVTGALFRYNDDGEPSGTAGPPILQQIEQRGLTNTLVVVTRYYGGTKLGTGGLVRAYGQAASDVLDGCTIIQCVIREPLRLTFSYGDTGPAMHLIERFDAQIAESNYSDETELIVQVRRSELDRFVGAFTDALGGRGSVERL